MKKSSVLKILTGILTLLSANLFAAAQGGFVSVSTKNFKFVSDAGEEKVLREARRLEQFRAAIRHAFPELKVDAPVPPTVLIFKDSDSFAPYKPVLENGLADRSVSGFFQSSDEASYIALSAGRDPEKSSGTIFHEYVHFLTVNNFQTPAMPAWLNEGLAEYFQTFRMKNDRRAIFGELQKHHLRLLRQYRLVPLETLAAVDYASLARMDTNEKNLFYAQSWAAVHYLTQKNDGLIVEPVKRYLALLAENKSPEIAFETAFKTSLSQAEKELEVYISKSFFKARAFDPGKKTSSEAHFETEPISEAEWLRHLGDLLFQSRRYDRAAGLFSRSLALDENSAAGHLALGKVFLKQGNTAAAAAHFEKALALGGEEEYAASYYLADVLYRENLSADGFVNAIPPERARKIRELLKNTIRQKPRLIEAYKMLASIALANDDEISESIGFLQTALKIQPQNFRLEYILAQLYLRRKDFANARQTALGLGRTCIEKDFCERVKSFLDVLGSIEEKERELAELRKKYGLENVDLEAENQLPPEEAMNRALNRALRKPQENEKRFVGFLREIRCGSAIAFSVEGEDGNLKLGKPSFDGIMLISFSSNTAGMRIECGRPKTEMKVVATYKTGPVKTPDSDGELLVLEFVPKEFKLIE